MPHANCTSCSGEPSDSPIRSTDCSLAKSLLDSLLASYQFRNLISYPHPHICFGRTELDNYKPIDFRRIPVSSNYPERHIVHSNANDTARLGASDAINRFPSSLSVKSSRHGDIQFDLTSVIAEPVAEPVTGSTGTLRRLACIWLLYISCSPRICKRSMTNFRLPSGTVVMVRSWIAIWSSFGGEINRPGEAKSKSAEGYSRMTRFSTHVPMVNPCRTVSTKRAASRRSRLKSSTGLASTEGVLADWKGCGIIDKCGTQNSKREESVDIYVVFEVILIAVDLPRCLTTLLVYADFRQMLMSLYSPSSSRCGWRA